VRLEGVLWDGFEGSLQLLVQGWVPPDGPLRVTDNRLYLQSRAGVSYQGRISVFGGMQLRGHIHPDRAGAPPLAVTIDLLGSRAGVVSGIVRAARTSDSMPAGLSPGV
jgi:hypothetical protein